MVKINRVQIKNPSLGQKKSQQAVQNSELIKSIERSPQKIIKTNTIKNNKHRY